MSEAAKSFRVGALAVPLNSSSTPVENWVIAVSSENDVQWVGVKALENGGNIQFENFKSSAGPPTIVGSWASLFFGVVDKDQAASIIRTFTELPEKFKETNKAWTPENYLSAIWDVVHRGAWAKDHKNIDIDHGYREIQLAVNRARDNRQNWSMKSDLSWRGQTPLTAFLMRH
ncbi:uncharacterized protein MAM_06500 [Metarhizium album ARSEF 1941]|uniref:Uncharacterized protein n=1 Tax=Metarhizium album (strain ARSEF 1941) TaxID=1081103 RepID=A0A0B2WPV2_METAS|nr:uncharacterized protein MAM_06500 [Metarhizium album ARSEF 1941]KHN95659.1 hypothetical protein MAM_06500 [Metarhizium album ARSEF 1941]